MNRCELLEKLFPDDEAIRLRKPFVYAVLNGLKSGKNPILQQFCNNQPRKYETI